MDIDFAALAAAGAVIFGIYQYRQGQVTQRQHVLFDHIRELNESPDMRLARELLGYGRVRKPDLGKPDQVWVNVDELNFLKLEDPKRVADQDELEIKNSLDTFIAFLGKVGYSLKVGAIKRHEIIYFYYWIHQTLSYPKVQAYINNPNNEFPLYQMFLKEPTKYGILSKLRKPYKYEVEWKTRATEKQVQQLTEQWKNQEAVSQKTTLLQEDVKGTSKR